MSFADVDFVVEIVGDAVADSGDQELHFFALETGRGSTCACSKTSVSSVGMGVGSQTLWSHLTQDRDDSAVGVLVRKLVLAEHDHGASL